MRSGTPMLRSLSSTGGEVSISVRPQRQLHTSPTSVGWGRALPRAQIGFRAARHRHSANPAVRAPDRRRGKCKKRRSARRHGTPGRVLERSGVRLDLPRRTGGQRPPVTAQQVRSVTLGHRATTRVCPSVPRPVGAGLAEGGHHVKDQLYRRRLAEDASDEIGRTRRLPRGRCPPKRFGTHSD